MVDDTDGAELELVGELADEFLARWKSGQSLSIEEFASQHPEVAESIRALFPVLLLLERHQPVRSRASTPANDGSDRPDVNCPVAWASMNFSASWDAEGWGSSSKPGKRPWIGTSRSRSCPAPRSPTTHTRRRFLREARIIARLRHPRIVPIHTVGEHDDVLYLRHGPDQRHQPGSTPEPRNLAGANGPGRARWVARLGNQAAESLAYAHGQGVLHRDVKPSNFVLDQEGRLWLTDFGLAKLLGDPP